jgi:LVIVD repeat
LKRRRLLLGACALLLVATGVPAAVGQMSARQQGLENLFFSQNENAATNSDMAFWGDLAYVGNYDGFRIFDISDPSNPTLVTTFECFGPQNDVSVWDTDDNGAADVLFMSIDRTLSGPECGSEPVDTDDPTGWEGIRVIDVSDPANPAQIGAVYQDCGSHTHTLYPDEARDRLLILNPSYPLSSGPTCGAVRGPEAGRDPLHGVVQVVQVPMDDPAAASELTELPINYPGDPDNQFTWGEHGLAGQEEAARACHDIAVFLPKNLVAAACAEQAQLWKLDPDTMLPDTENPLWVFDNPVDENGATGDPNDPHIAIDFWHSATFSWDGKIVNFSDESFAGFDPEAPQACPPVSRQVDPETGEVLGFADTGRTYFLRVSDGQFLSHFMIPRPEEGAYCSTHQGNTIALPGRYMLVQAWYQGGVDIVNFTRPRHPREIAYFDFLPDGEEGSDNWAHYWYENDPVPDTPLNTFGQDGHGEHGRGFEIFETTARIGARLGLDHLNPQTQEVMFP